MTRNTVARWERDEMDVPGRILDLGFKPIERKKPRKQLIAKLKKRKTKPAT